MPFVRYARDRRGYETLYVMHAFEPDGRGRPRVLYACRTVPYARVGRAPIDDSVQRRIETAYPNIGFDWPRLLKDAAASAPRPEKPDTRNEPRKGRGRERKPRPEVPSVPVVPLVPQVRFEAAAAIEPPGAVVDPPVTVADATPEPEPTEPGTELVERPEPAELVEPPAPQVLEVPETIGALFVDRAWPVVGLVGEARALVLRGRYIEIANRVRSRVEDAAEQRRLAADAARLNPEGWSTDEQARAGVAGFDAAYDAITARIRQQQPAV